MSVIVTGDIVVAVSCEPQQLCITVKAVAAAGVGDQREKIITAEIIDPGKRCPGCRDDIFPVCIIKISVFHQEPHFRAMAAHEKLIDSLNTTFKKTIK